MEFKPDYECKFCRKKESEHGYVEEAGGYVEDAGGYFEDAGVGAGGYHHFQLSDFDKGFRMADTMWRKRNTPMRAI